MISKTVLRWLTLVALVGLCLGVMVPAAAAAPVGTEIPSCPFTISSPGNFFLKKNLTATGDDCIKVHSSNVAIDMNGKTIMGDGTHNGITDNGFIVRAVAIANGKIKDFNNGIDFFGFTGCCSFLRSEVITIEKVDSLDNKSDGIFIEGCCNNITDVKANTNGFLGIQVAECCNLFNKIQANDNAGDDGLRVDRCCNTVNQVTANRNGDDGIDVRDCCTGISNSQANDNKNNGIFMTSGDNLVANVRTNGNKSDGIDSTDFDDVVTNATASNNGNDGMEFEEFDDVVADSVANDNKVVGIDLHVGSGNTVTDVTANHNATGVVLSCAGFDSGSAVNVRAHGNSVTQLSEIGTCTNLLNKAP